DSFGGTAAVGTIVARLGVIHKGVVVNAVLAGVVPFVDVAVLPAQFEKPLHGADVAKIGGANKFVSGHAEFVPEASPGSSHLGNEFGFGDACFFRGAFDVNAVFVGTGGHHDFIAAHTLVTANDEIGRASCRERG